MADIIKEILSTVENPKSTEAAEVKETESEYIQIKVSDWNAVNKRLEGQSKVLTRLESHLKKLDGNKPEQKEEQKPKETSLPDVARQVEEMRLEREKQANKDAERNKKWLKKDLVDALKDSGVKESFAKDKAELFMLKYKENFALNSSGDDDIWEYSTVENEEKKSMDLKAWVKSWIETDEGKEYVAPKKNPVSNMSKSNAPIDGNKKTITYSEMKKGNYDTKVLASGGYHIVY